MRPTSKAFLARQLTAAITRAACKGAGMQWSEWEAAHAATGTPASAAAAAAPALALCAACPELTPCALRAEYDRYTGLAAGAVYSNGTRKSPTAVLRRPVPPPQLRAG